MIQRSKFSLGYYLTIFLIMLFLESMFFSGSAVKELPYNTFKDLIQKNKIESVIIESDRIYGLLKSEQAPPKAAAQSTSPTKKTDTEKNASPPKPGFTPQQKQTPWYLSFEKNLAKSETGPAPGNSTPIHGRSPQRSNPAGGSATAWRHLPGKDRITFLIPSDLQLDHSVRHPLPCLGLDHAQNG